MKLIAISILIFLAACSSHRTRNKVYATDIELKGGVFKSDEWDESLVLKKISWYRDSTILYELLFGQIKKESPFANWLEKRKLDVSRCDEFYVGLIYADLMHALHGTTLVVAEIKESGLEEEGILDFSRHLRAHQNYKDWNLEKHKVLGFCRNKTKTKEVLLTLPGYKSFKLL